MGGQVRVKVAATDGTPPGECVKFCVGIDAIEATERLSIDLRSDEVKGLVVPTTISGELCEAFRKEPAQFAEWCHAAKKARKVVTDVFSITMNCLTAALPSFGTARIVAPHGHSTTEIVAAFEFVVHTLRDLRVQVAITASDGDSTLLKKVDPALAVLMAISKRDCKVAPATPLQHQPRVVAEVGPRCARDRRGSHVKECALHAL
jgi:hypothetical protein